MITDNLPFYRLKRKEETYEFVKDEIKLFRLLKNKLGKDWKYYDNVNNPIVTTTNKLGYRSKTVLPTDNYYIAIGCSNTFGSYLHEEDRYSNLIEKKTGTPVINLGAPGCGTQLVFLNLMKLKYSNYPQPKAIFIQWPEHLRFELVRPNGKEILRIRPPNRTDRNFPSKNAVLRSQAFKYLASKSGALEYHARIAFDSVHAIYNDTPIVDFSLDSVNAEFYGVKEIERVDKARDNQHSGTETNKIISDFILGKI